MKKEEKLLTIIDSMSNLIGGILKQCTDGSYDKGFCQGQLDILQLVESLINDKELLDYLYGGVK